MKILLLGASGQLGRQWQLRLTQNPNDIVLLPYSSSQLDITHYQELSSEIQKQQPDVVVNCAAFTDVDAAEEQKTLTRKVNVEAVLYLAELSKNLGFKLLHYSTDYVFPGSKQDRKNLPNGYTEDHPTDPINWYGRTKWEGEQAIRQTTEDHIIIRTSWLCGQFGSNFVKTMLKLGRERDKLQVVNDQWGSPSFTKNVVNNSIQLLKSGSVGTYHLTSKGMITWFDFAQAIFNMAEIDVELEAVSSDAFSTKAKRPHFSKLNTGKIEAMSGNKIINWEEGLENLLAVL